MTTTDYVAVDALKSYISCFIEKSEKQQAIDLEMFDAEGIAYHDGILQALSELEEQIDKMKVSI